MFNVDLHSHSNVSDGVLAPATLAKYAHQAGVNAWALTDHDEVGGIQAARSAAAGLGMAFVPGVEISITWANTTVHIVGLQIDDTNPTLLQGLADTRNGRDARGREIGAQLARAGIPVIAHPGRYKFSPLQEGALFDEFKQLGGGAIEVVTGSHTPEQYEIYAEQARRYGFMASRGTDFHAPGESRVDFALLPPLPAKLTPVWHDWF